MKVIFSASIGSQDKDRESLITHLIPAYITSLGHDVNLQLYNPSGPSDGNQFDTLADQIIEADAYIGEMSRASQTLGFQLSFALNHTKPSLYLYEASTHARPGTILSRNPSRLLRIKPYTSDNYGETLSNFLSFAEKQQSSTRTSFMSTIRIDRYVADFASAQHISKGEAIRQLLDKGISRQ